MDDKKKMVIGIAVICIVLFLVALGKKEPTRENRTTVKLTNTPNPTATEKPTPKEIVTYELSEEKYKSLCKEYDYDEIMFTKNSLKNKNVKLKLRFNSKKYFTMDSLSNAYFLDLKRKYNIMFYFFEGTVKRSDEKNYPYVGENITIIFNEEYGIEPDNYHELDEVIAYGEIVDFNTNTKSGFNYCVFIPKYIEKSE